MPTVTTAEHPTTTDRPIRRGIAGRPSRRAGGRILAPLGLLALLALAGGTGCSMTLRRAVVVEELLEPIAPEAARAPSPADLAAARLARIALVSADESPEVDAAFESLVAAKRESDSKRLLPLATDLRNTTTNDPIAYRDASRALRKTRGIDPRLAGRLDQTIAEDPLKLAQRRRRDDWHRLFARTFNSVAEPLGQSAITGFILAPFTLTNSFIHYFAEFSNAEPLSQTGRQALVLRQEFLAAHPESALAPKVEALVARGESRYARTLALRRVRAAERALEQDDPGLALHQSRTAQQRLEPHPDAHDRLRRRAAGLEAQAREALDRRNRLLDRALEAKATGEATQAAERRLAIALLADPALPGVLDPELARYREAAGRAGRGRVGFIRALAQHEGGHEEPARRTLAALSGGAQPNDPMTRHARQLLEDDWQNPYDAFRRLRRIGRREALAFRLAGEWVNRPRYPNLPVPLAYLIDTPTIAMTIVMAPIRALISPFTGFPDFQRATALAGYRYLLRQPEGAHQREVVDWLYRYERGEDRYGRALRLADLMPDFPEDERLELVEKSASEQVEQLDRLERRDQRASVLRGVATEFPDSESGRDAGLLARQELEKASPQHIRISRGFLLENPTVAGDTGLGLNPRLLNGDVSDGELHEDGVVLRGGRVLEILLTAEGRDEDTPPVSRVQRISKQRLTRLTAELDEAVLRNSLIDAGARFDADANRETYLEQARLGLTDEADLRPTAESSFVYQSLRERYGAVRGRDSILPFDLVFRGSLGDFSLGAFPRWRPPAETPDAFLYR
jgi:hypothetical protein